MGFSLKTYFAIYSLLLGWFAYSYWFIDGGMGIGVNLFELSIGLWIAGLTPDIQSPFLYKKGVLMAVVGGGGDAGEAPSSGGWYDGGKGGGVDIAE